MYYRYQIIELQLTPIVSLHQHPVEWFWAPAVTSDSTNLLKRLMGTYWMKDEYQLNCCNLHYTKISRLVKLLDSQCPSVPYSTFLWVYLPFPLPMLHSRPPLFFPFLPSFYNWCLLLRTKFRAYFIILNLNSCWIYPPGYQYIITFIDNCLSFLSANRIGPVTLLKV